MLIRGSSLFTFFPENGIPLSDGGDMLPFAICTGFVCTRAGGGRDKGLSFLTHCLVTLSGYDRACTCSSSFSALLFPLRSLPQKMIGIALCAVGVTERRGRMVEGGMGEKCVCVCGGEVTHVHRKHSQGLAAPD